MADLMGLVGQYGDVAAQVIGKVSALKKRLDNSHSTYSAEHAAIFEEMGILQAEINEVASVLRNHINIDEMARVAEAQEFALVEDVVAEEAGELAAIQTELHAAACAVCEDARATVLQMTNTQTGVKRPLMLVDGNLIEKLRKHTSY
jgi:hypothetical protein